MKDRFTSPEEKVRLAQQHVVNAEKALNTARTELRQTKKDVAELKASEEEKAGNILAASLFLVLGYVPKTIQTIVDLNERLVRNSNKSALIVHNYSERPLRRDHIIPKRDHDRLFSSTRLILGSLSGAPLEFHGEGQDLEIVFPFLSYITNARDEKRKKDGPLTLGYYNYHSPTCGSFILPMIYKDEETDEHESIRASFISPSLLLSEGEKTEIFVGDETPKEYQPQTEELWKELTTTNIQSDTKIGSS